jgi:hypothetical protein
MKVKKNQPLGKRVKPSKKLSPQARKNAKIDKLFKEVYR